MHWIKKFRTEYRRKDGKTGISQAEFAKMVRRCKVYCVREGSKRKRLRTVGCSEALIEIVENGGVTHPNIAEAIATVCGATEEQKRSLMHEKHWGGYKEAVTPQPWAEMEIVPRKKEKKQKKEDQKAINGNCKAVVQIDRQGNVIKRYDAMSEAAKDAHIALSSVSLRCNHLIGDETDEFSTRGCTWRFEAEWSALNEEQRNNELYLAKLRVRRKGKNETGHEGIPEESTAHQLG